MTRPMPRAVSRPHGCFKQKSRRGGEVGVLPPHPWPRQRAEQRPGRVGGFSRHSARRPAYLFRSQMISGLGLPSALQVKNTVFPEVTSASCGSDVIRGLSVTRNKDLLS